MADWEDTNVPMERAPGGNNGQHRTGYGHTTESITIGSLTATPSAKSGAEKETITISPRSVVAGRPLTDRAKAMLANIEAHDSVDAPEAVETPPAAAEPAVVAAAPAAAPAVAPPAAAPAAPVAPPSAVPTDDTKAERDRILESNAKLLSEVETLRKRPSRGEPTAREKTLDEVARMYAEDPVGANRKLAALALGVDDDKHADVDRNLTWLYHDLTERELKVPLDASVKATRENERTRLLLAQDKREREAPAKPAEAQPDDDQQFAAHAQLVASHMSAEKYPLLMALSEDFDHDKPNAVVLRAIRRGFQTGELDPKSSDDKLIDAASQRLETRYQALAEKILKARPQPSTAAPQAPAATETNAGSTGNGTRTITAASASVAPASLPVATKSEPTTTEKPKYKNEAERRKAIAARLFPDAT